VVETVEQTSGTNQTAARRSYNRWLSGDYRLDRPSPLRPILPKFKPARENVELERDRPLLPDRIDGCTVFRSKTLLRDEL